MKKQKRLAIRGKVINVEKIGEKSVKQFAQQLKQNGIILEPEYLNALHAQLTAKENV